MPIGSLVGDLMRRRGWHRKLDAARVEAQWESVVGASVAEHCQPVNLADDGTLEVVADSPGWATQLAYLKGTLIDRLAKVVGPGLVKDVTVRTQGGRPRRR
jgi:predicted nucleic acid-binding Zn ribbon protein